MRKQGRGEGVEAVGQTSTLLLTTCVLHSSYSMGGMAPGSWWLFMPGGERR